MMDLIVTVEPDGADNDQQDLCWVQVNSGRWQQALDLEKKSRIVLCDSNPLKLHNSWCLARCRGGALVEVSTRTALCARSFGHRSSRVHRHDACIDSTFAGVAQP
jgi:hypothetical protein